MIYFNNAATSFPKPECVLETVTEYLRRPPVDSKRSSARIADQMDIYTSCRMKLARLFNIENHNNISFTSGSTHAINLAARGLNLANAHVITTAIEHSAVIRSLKILECETNTQLTIVECDEKGMVDPADIANAIRDNTKAIFVNHVSNVLNSKIDLEQVAQIAHDENIILVVDASQSAGCIPVDVKSLGIDVLAFTGHKSLFGLAGIGGLYIRDDLNIKPLMVGGTGLKSYALYQTEERPAYYEAGTQNFIGVVSLEKGVSYLLETGLDYFNQKKKAIYDYAYGELSKLSDVLIYGNKEYVTPIISFRIKNINPGDVGILLANEYDIIVRTGLLCAPLIHKYIGTDPDGIIRISFSCFNTESEIDTFMEAVNDIIKLVKANPGKEIVDKDGLVCV